MAAVHRSTQPLEAKWKGTSRRAIEARLGGQGTMKTKMSAEDTWPQAGHQAWAAREGDPEGAGHELSKQLRWRS